MGTIQDNPFGVGWDRARGWRDQYERMVRWYNRFLDELMKEAEHGGWSQWPYDLWDTSMAYFQSAFHLKDWIIREHPHLRDDLECFISKNPRMRLCADICNGTKHGRVDRNSRTSAHLTGLREFAPDRPSQSRWLVWGPDGPINLDILAQDVLREWQHFLHRHGLETG